MVSKEENKYVIWPIYFDTSVSRHKGRKIAKKYAIEKPSIVNITKAAKSLKLNPILEDNCAYPSRHWKKEGRVLVDKKDLKSKLLVKIANKL